jgi:ribosomal protein S27AE
MKISPRAKFIYGAIIFIVIGLAIGVMAAVTHARVMSSIFIMFFAWIFIGSWVLSQIRCPNCGTSVAYQGKLGGLSIYAGFVRSECQNCGHDLTTTDCGN